MAISKIVYKSSPNASPETWMDATPATAVAADIIAPKTAMLADGLLTVGTGSGGGASNVVQGTFKGTTTGAAMDVTIPYTGNGYPIAGIIYPLDGASKPDGTFATTIKRYAIQSFAFIKTNALTTPSYSNTTGPDSATVIRSYKSSASDATSYSGGATQNVAVFQDNNAVSSGTTGSSTVRMKSATKMSVYIASTSYGFMANIEYKYTIIYSS